MTEKEFRQQVIDLARYCGWEVYFTWNSLHSPSGFPDLAIAREESNGSASLCFLELKTDSGKLSPAQEKWLNLLAKVPGVTAKCICPSDWDCLILTLSRNT